MKQAIFGGTFDPIHKAHLAVAREAKEQFGLDQILFVTSGNPPHKPAGSTTAFAHRHRMVELACQGEPGLLPSKIEEGDGKSYSFDTIRKVRSVLAPGDELYFVIGADAFAEIGSWYRSGDVVTMVDFIVVSRPGHRYAIPEGARVHRLETMESPVSSSEIRRLLSEGKRPDSLPETVFEYICRNGLYGFRCAGVGGAGSG